MTRYCYVPGCRSGRYEVLKANKTNRIKNASLFRPQSEEMRELWDKAIGREDRRLSRTDVVCALHFYEDDIVRYYVTKLADGTLHQLERDVPKVKPDAVPSIALPHNRSNGVISLACWEDDLENNDFIPRNDKPSKASLPNESSKKMLSITLEDDLEDNDLITLSNSTSPIVNGENTNETSTTGKTGGAGETELDLIDSVRLPSPFWTSSKIGKRMAFCCWNRTLSSIPKRVVVDEDLKLKIHFNDVPIYIDRLSSVASFSKIADALRQINMLHPCDGANEQQRSPNCFGYAQNPKMRTPRMRCVPCKRYRQHLTRKQKRMLEKRMRMDGLSLNENVEESETIQIVLEEESPEEHDVHQESNTDEKIIRLDNK